MSVAGITVVGIGADGIAGLSATARAELARATVIYGSRRQLGLLDGDVTAQRRPWPSPLLPGLREDARRPPADTCTCSLPATR